MKQTWQDADIINTVGTWLSAILYSTVFFYTQTFVIEITSQHPVNAKLHTTNHERLRSSPSPTPIREGGTESVEC